MQKFATVMHGSKLQSAIHCRRTVARLARRITRRLRKEFKRRRRWDRQWTPMRFDMMLGPVRYPWTRQVNHERRVP